MCHTSSLAIHPVLYVMCTHRTEQVMTYRMSLNQADYYITVTFQAKYIGRYTTCIL